MKFYGRFALDLPHVAGFFLDKKIKKVFSKKTLTQLTR
jgi:hypothetical protein